MHLLDENGLNAQVFATNEVHFKGEKKIPCTQSVEVYHMYQSLAKDYQSLHLLAGTLEDIILRCFFFTIQFKKL